MSTAMQVRLRHWPGMKVSWLGAGAVVHSGDEPSQGAAQLVVSPHGSTECAVVISSHTVKLQPAMIEELAEVLANGLPRGFTALRFVAWDGACATNERPAAAHMLAMRLGIDVIAAAGPLLGVPGGSLFAPIGRGEHRPGGFWRFRTGAQPARVGWRFPAPQWEADLSAELPELPGDLVLDQIPAGLWLHRRRVGSVTDLAYSVPTDEKHPSLILSHPSEEPLHRDELASAVAAIPALAADRCVFTPYGQHPIVDGPIGPVVAEVLGRAVHVRTGLPLCAPAGQRAVVTIDQKGLPRWRTFARELWHAPRTGAPRPVDWVNPCPEVLDKPAGAAIFALGSGWVLEVVQAGVWVRPEKLAESADWIRAVPVDVNRCAVVIGAPHAVESTPPGHVIADVLEKLPVDARKRAYLAVPRGAAPNVFILATALREALPEPGEVELVGPAAATPAASLPAFPPSTTTTGSFPAVGPAGPAGSDGRHANGRRDEAPYLVDGRPANGHPSGAHPTVSRPAAAYDEPRGRRSLDEPRTGGFVEPRTGAFAEPRTNPFEEREPRTNPFEEQRTGGFAALPREDPRGRSAYPDPATGSFTPVSPNGAHRPSGGRPAGHAADQGLPPSGGHPGNGHNGSGAGTGAHNGNGRPAAGHTYNGNGQAGRPQGRPIDATGSFPAASGEYGFRGGPESTGPINGANGPTTGPTSGLSNPMTGPINGLAGGPATGHPGNGQSGRNGHSAGGLGPNGQAPNGQMPSGHAPSGMGTGGFGPNGHGRGGPSGAGPGMHPELHVAPPRTFHRDAQPLSPSGPGAPQGYSFDAPDYDEHHFDLPVPPSRHHDESTGRMPAQRMPAHDDSGDTPEETTGSINTGREIRSHSKKGKTTRADDRTSTQELDRLLGFFDEIRRAKAWDEDASAPETQADHRAAAGQPPVGPRRARH